MGKNKIERQYSMYKFRTGWEKDHERWEEVNADEQCEDCGELNRNCQCSETADEEPAQPSFFDRHGSDERDDPPEEERGYRDDREGPVDELNYRWR